MKPYAVREAMQFLNSTNTVYLNVYINLKRLHDIYSSIGIPFFVFLFQRLPTSLSSKTADIIVFQDGEPDVIKSS